MNNQLEQAIVVACAADENYAMPLAVTICSLVANLSSQRQVILFILDGGIKPFQKRRIEQSLDPQKARIKWIQASNKLLESLPISEKYPVSIYYRFLLPEIIPDFIQKIIYLDSDLIVQGNLEDLWNLELGEQYALAVQDICCPHMGMARHLDCEKLGVSKDCKYLNTGVLVINLEQWRKDNITKQVIEMIKDNPENMLFPDQDALNIVLAGRWGELDPRWNQMHAVHAYNSWQESPYSEKVFNDVVQHPYVVHFTTPPKPWSRGCDHPERELFFQYLDMTAWRGWRNTSWRRAFRKVKQILQKFVR